MKKEVADHISRAFFDRKSKKKKDSSFNFFIAVSLVFSVSLILLLSFLSYPVRKGVAALKQNIVFEKHDGPYVLDFDFESSSSKIKSLTLEIPNTDLMAYKQLRFSVRLEETQKNLSGVLKIGLENKRREVAVFYAPKIGKGWNKIVLPLSSFGNIHDWSCLSKLSFVLEEWNISSKKGKLFIDGVEFSK